MAFSAFDVTVGTSSSLTAVAHGGGRWVAVEADASRVWLSTDGGETWAAKTTPLFAPSIASIAWNGALFCVFFYGYSVCMTSPDGETWTTRTLPISAAWRDLIWTGTSFVGIAESTTTYVTGVNGIAWTTRTTPVNSARIALTKGGAALVMVMAGFSGKSARSLDDGLTWVEFSMPSTSAWADVAHANGVFVALGAGVAPEGAFATSPDGAVWAPRGAYPGIVPSLSSVRLIAESDTFVTLRDNATCLIGYDGASWTEQSIPHLASWKGVAGDGAGKIVGVGSSGKILVATLGPPPPPPVFWTSFQGTHEIP